MNARGERSEIRATTESGLRYLSMIVLPLIAFLVLFPEYVIRVFIGARWLAAAPAFSILCAYAFVIALTRPYFALLAGLGRSDVMGRIGIVMAVVNIALNVVLIPDDIASLGIRLAGLKATGAALATLVSGAIGLALLQREAGRHAGAPVRVAGFARQAAAVAVMGLALHALNLVPFLALDRWYDLFVYAALGGGIYFGALALLRGFTMEDVRFFLRATNAIEMFRYVRGELRPTHEDD